MNMLSVMKNFPKIIKRGGGKILFKLQKNKPQIMVVSGAAIMIGGFIWAVCSARKIDDTISESENKIAELENRKAEVEKNEDGLSEKEQKDIIALCDKQIREVKMNSVWQMFLLVGLPSIIFAGGLCITVGGHAILVRRFGEVSTMLASLQSAFDRYRQMNIAEHGEECDRRYRYGIVGDMEEGTLITDENGIDRKIESKVPIVDPNSAASLYTFIFSEETSRRCPKDPVNAISFLKSQEKFWNIWMSSTGKPVTLAMILDEIGIELDPDDPRNDYILIAGWRPNGDGDNKISFGIMRAINRPALRMEENVVVLNFNCDGNIYHSTRYTKDGKKVC